MIPAVEPGNAAVWSVSELSGALKRTLEDAFGHVRLRGEISGYRGPHASGHAYFCLKDRDARLDAVVWKTSFARMRFKPQEGLEVIATGRITTFPGKSTYQIVVEQLEPAGVGALMALLEERRRKLAAEGLFATERKRQLPFLPRVVGVVTSPTGAVIRDILHRLEDRFPRRVLLWPVRVQGESCADEVAAAIVGLNALPADGPMPRPDVIIVARGGGSLEDLWGFNEEAVVRAAAQSGVPVISAVGHETDWTLLDHVADLRAPTPTGAAEMAVPVRLELLSRLNSLAGRQAEGARRGAETRRRDLRSAVRALPGAEAILAGPRQRLDRAAGKLPAALLANARIHERQLQAASGRLGRQSPQVRLAAVGARLTQAERRLPLEFRRGFEERRKDLLAITTRLQRARDASLRAEALRLAACRERVGVLSGRAARAVATLLQRDRRQLAAFGGLLGSLSYRSVLARGYALVRGSDDRPIARAAAIAPGQIVTIEFADGRRKAQAEGGKAKRRAEPLVQTELFDN